MLAKCSFNDVDGGFARRVRAAAFILLSNHVASDKEAFCSQPGLRKRPPMAREKGARGTVVLMNFRLFVVLGSKLYRAAHAALETEKSD